MSIDQQQASRRLLLAVPIVLAMLSMIGPFSVDTPFPAFGEMKTDLGVGTTELQLVVTVYLASFALMSVFHGPLSDALGRRPVMVVSISVYVVASIGCALSTSLAWLLVFRCVQGLSAGGATIISRTVVRDLFDGAMAQRLMSRVAVIFGLAPAIGPIFGGWLVQLGPWQLIFAFHACFGVLLIAAVLFVLPESHPPDLRTPLRLGAVLAGLSAVGRRAAFHRLAWTTAFVFGAQFLYIGSAAIFVVDVLGRGELDFWMLFVPMIGAMMLGSWLCGRAAGRITARRLVSWGTTTSFIGGVIGVAVAASPLGDDLPWAVVGLTLMALGNGVTYPTLQLLLLDQFPTHRGAVMSLSSFLALVLNAVTAVALAPLAGTTALGFAVSALVLVGAGQLCWSWHCALEDRDCVVAPVSAEREPTDLL